MEFSGVGEKEILKKERRREGGSARVIKQGGPPVKEVLLSRRFSCQGGSPANDLNF
jgi:hypothetical protein